MLKFKVERNKGWPLLVLGLTKMNIQTLQEGQILKFNLAALNMPGEVCIFAGDTEESMMKELEGDGVFLAAKASIKNTDEESP